MVRGCLEWREFLKAKDGFGLKRRCWLSALRECSQIARWVLLEDTVNGSGGGDDTEAAIGKAEAGQQQLTSIICLPS